VNCSQKGINEEYFYLFVDGTLASVEYSFHHLRYRGYREAFIQKYGPPTSSKVKSYKNLMGGEWQGEALYWENGTSVIALNEYDKNIESSHVTISNAPSMAKVLTLWWPGNLTGSHVL